MSYDRAPIVESCQELMEMLIEIWSGLGRSSDETRAPGRLWSSASRDDSRARLGAWIEHQHILESLLRALAYSKLDWFKILNWSSHDLTLELVRRYERASRSKNGWYRESGHRLEGVRRDERACRSKNGWYREPGHRFEGVLQYGHDL